RPSTCLLGAQAVLRLPAGLAVHRPAAHRSSAPSRADSSRPGRAGARLDPGGADALLRAPPHGGRAVAERPTTRRGKGDAASPQRVLLAVVASEQRDDGVAA